MFLDSSTVRMSAMPFAVFALSVNARSVEREDVRRTRSKSRKHLPPVSVITHGLYHCMDVQNVTREDQHGTRGCTLDCT